MMSRTWVVLWAAMLCGCGDKAPSGTTGASMDEAAARDVRGELTKMLGAWERLDPDFFVSGLAKEGFLAAYDFDLENKPVRIATHEDAIAYVTSMMSQVKAMGATLKVDVRSIDCRATSTVAWCAMEFDFTAKMPDGSVVSQPTRATATLRKGGDGWKWVQWHSSLSK